MFKTTVQTIEGTITDWTWSDGGVLYELDKRFKVQCETPWPRPLNGVRIRVTRWTWFIFVWTKVEAIQ